MQTATRSEATVRVRVDATLRRWPVTRDAPPWTGHQPWLWHPGILAKYLVADALAQPSGVTPVHLVVDHDPQDAFRLAVPVRDGDRLSVLNTSLGLMNPEVPPACQPSVDCDDVIDALRRLSESTLSDLSRLIAAFDDAECREADTLGEQMAAALDTLLSPWVSAPPRRVFSASLHAEPWFGDELTHLLHDAERAVTQYNAAVRRHPDAGVAPLRVEPDRVELPVWLLGVGRPRRRVFADIADAEPWLVTEAGERLDPKTAWLAPKALWMTALLRRRVGHCAGFIHGTGGGTYDSTMEHWWRDWRLEPLAPQAVVSADATLPFDAPVHERATLERAVWLTHHLPHNLDRIPGVAGAHPELADEKAELLKRMDDDRDKERRRSAFERVHTINAALADAHHVLLDRAAAELRRARVGAANAAIAQRRDWCFALYPEDQLGKLRDAIRQRVSEDESAEHTG